MKIRMITTTPQPKEIFFNKKKVCCISDIHIGVHQNGSLWHKVTLEWVQWLDKQLKSKGIEDIIICGDLFHYRDEIAVNTIHVVTQFLNILKDYNIVMIVGNHDAYYKDRSDVNSLSILSGWSNITVIPNVCETVAFGRKLGFCSWGVKDKDIPTADILFGHFEVQNFRYNFAKICSHGTPVKRLLKKSPNIISGHFHIKQSRQYDEGKITYLGNPFEMDFGDVDDQKGYYILDIEKIDLKFYKNVISPKHKKIYISDIINEERAAGIKKQIKNNFIKFIIDVDVPPDIIEELIDEFSKLKPKSLNVDYQVNFNKLKFDDNDQDLSCVSVEAAISEFINLMEVDNKKDVEKYTLDLYKRCA